MKLALLALNAPAKMHLNIKFSSLLCTSMSGADPGILDREFKFTKGVRFVDFT